MGTTVAAVRSAFRNALQVRDGLAGVAVDYGDPLQAGTGESIWLGTTQTPVEERPFSFGQGFYDESYEFKVHAVAALDMDYEAAEARLAEMVDEVLDVVFSASKPFLGISAIQFFDVRSVLWDTVVGESDGPVRAEAVISIFIKARVNNGS